MSGATHTLDIYGVDIHLATTEREWKKLRKRLTYLDDTPNAAGFTHFAIWEPSDHTSPVPVVAFWIRNELTTDPLQLVETCAHEAVHAATHILAWAGHDIRGDDGNDEPTAYLAGWLTRWIWDNATPVNDKEGAV